jgi:hypothetical protein
MIKKNHCERVKLILSLKHQSNYTIFLKKLKNRKHP